MKGIIKIATLALSFFVLGLVQAEGKDFYKGEQTDFPRKALIGTDCVINELVSVADVLSGSSSMSNIMDGNLSNYATISGAAVLGLVEDPFIRIKDRKYYYKKGTKAGFCIQAGGENSILAVSVLSHMSIIFYKDGDIVGTVPVEEGQSAGALDVNLIQIPGEAEAASFFTATSPGDFDEIGLLNGGIDVKVLNDFRIRYAFVGEAKEHILCTEEVKGLKADDAWYAPIYNKENIIDNDTTNYAHQPEVVFDAGVRLVLSWNDEYPAGMEVGFKILDAGLNVSIGANSRIVLENDKGQKQEVLLQGSVLGISLGGDSRKVAITAKQSFNKATLEIDGLSVAVGARLFYYGFVTEATEVPHHNDLGLTMDALIGQDVTSYTVSASKEVYWSIVSAPTDNELAKLSITQGPSKVATLSGMTEKLQGDYVIKAISADGCGCEGTITLTRGVKDAIPEECKTPLSNNIELSTVIHDSSGSLLSWSNVDQKENIIDDDMNSYAEYTAGLSIAENLQIVGVKTKNGSSFYSNATEDYKVGFVMESTSSLLDLDLLQFFRIRLYKGGEEVYDEVVDETNVLSLGLAGENQMAKVRYGITVPKNIEFDEITLWKSGVLSLGLSTVRIYGAFLTSTAVNCYDTPLSCGSTTLNADDNGTYINYNATGFEGTANVGAFMKDLENIIDDDLETCATIWGVQVLSKWTVAIKMGRLMGKSNQFGLVMDEKTYLALANVAGGMKVALYKGGVFQQETEEWGLIGVNAIGFGDKRYIFMTPKSEYDEVRITGGALVNLEAVSIYGVVVRDDLNGNGIPDCSEDPNVMNVSVTSDICIGDKLAVVGSGEPGKEYKISAGQNGDIIEETMVSIDEDGNYLWEFTPIATGEDVQLVIEEVEKTEQIIPNLSFNVHPREATWQSSSSNSDDWNEWSNWDNGAPWSCTNVIIPSNASTYPELVSTDFNPCNYIHFEPHAEVVNTPYLTYNKAWVEIELKPNRYYMVATPIKGIYSGDWFISKAGTDLPDYFTDLTEDNYPANRVTPTIYQRLWEHTALNKLATGGDGPVTISETKWTAPYNHMATSYEKRSGYDFNALSVWVHPDTPLNPDAEGDGSTYTFRFPKKHTTYFYSDMDGNILGLSNNLKRDATAGRFIYEAEDGTAQFPITMTYQNEIKTNYEDYPNHQVFLAGNPFMSHIDIEKFFDKNDHIKSIKVESTDGNYSSVVQDNNTIIAGSGDKKLRYIPPMQSFFVELSSTDEYNDKCSITYTEDMLTQQPGNNLRSASSSPSDVLYLSASASGQRSSAMLRFSASASDYYHEGEDADILIDDEVPPAVAVFTVADSHALDIQQRASGGDIPIGFVLPKAEEVTLRIDVPEEYAGWVLNDLETGKNYALHSGTNELELGRMLTNVGRFSLRGSAPTGNEVISASQPRIYCFREEGGNTLVVRSAEGMMARCEIYTLAGQLSGVASYETNEYRLPVPPGIKIVKVHFTDGITSTIKTY